jgi:predicted enzyme related to lactoylglutathione lyase
MSERKPLPGKFVWFELVTSDARKAQAFYAEVLGWKVHQWPMGAQSYEMILTGDTPDTMIGGYASPRTAGERARWISTVSVENVDAGAAAATANGGKVVDQPQDVPGVGRMARIVDPQGAELSVLKSATGDKPDGAASAGQFFWNELHTSDAAGAVAFYQKVVGFSARPVEMVPGDTYHILSRDGVDRGGASDHLMAGVSPHWLPYVYVDDVDATLTRATRQGARLPMKAEEIPGIGRFGVLEDPAGAILAVMKPIPRAK